MCNTSTPHDNNVSLFMCNFSKNSLSRISTLGAGGGVGASLKSQEECYPPLLIYNTRVILILQRKKKKNPSYITVVSIFIIYPTVKKVLNEKPYRYIYL